MQSYPEGFIFAVKWFWALAIAGNFINAAFYYVRARDDMARKPELAASYPRLICGYIIWMNAPWVVMGLVILAGGAENPLDFLAPREGGAGIKLFYGTLIVAWLAALYWILFRDGDVVLSRHKAFFSWYMPSSPYMIRLFVIFMSVAGFLVFFVLWSGHISFNFDN
ncbi:MAG: hypothetical protein LBM04_04140 [Opitutaceae bacterium]|jgi:hypothetical protein|nr:hypothetical protein [Opitutaceae bacterium]